MANNNAGNSVTSNKDVVIYCRVSTDDQHKTHLGLDAQLEACIRVCNQLELNVIKTFEETVSAKINPMERPVFRSAVQLAINNKAKIMIDKLDRLSREVYHISGFLNGYMIKNCPKLIIADNPSATEFELNLRAALAQEERRLISERTKAALAIKRSQGYELGKIGREVSLKNRREKTQEAFNLMVELRGQGYSYQKIADTLNADGFTTSGGGIWYSQMIHSRLKNIL